MFVKVLLQHTDIFQGDSRLLATMNETIEKVDSFLISFLMENLKTFCLQEQVKSPAFEVKFKSSLKFSLTY